MRKLQVSVQYRTRANEIAMRDVSTLITLFPTENTSKKKDKTKKKKKNKPNPKKSDGGDDNTNSLES